MEKGLSRDLREARIVYDLQRRLCGGVEMMCCFLALAPGCSNEDDLVDQEDRFEQHAPPHTSSALGLNEDLASEIEVATICSVPFRESCRRKVSPLQTVSRWKRLAGEAPLTS